MLARIVKLSSQEIDINYANPHDSALAAYLYALSLIDFDIAEAGAMIAYYAKNCWWADCVTEHLLSYTKIRDTSTSTESNEHQLLSDSAISVYQIPSNSWIEPIEVETHGVVYARAVNLRSKSEELRTTVNSINSSSSYIFSSISSDTEFLTVV